MPSRVGASHGHAIEVSFNHVMVYSRDVRASLRFYGGQLGFRVIEKMQRNRRPIYVRVRTSRGGGTMALHQLGPDQQLPSEDGIR
ncbi:MAG: VOC family protein, partial [Thermoplasmata archaeon]